MQKSATAQAPLATAHEASPPASDLGIRLRRSAEYIAVPLFALLVSAALFAVFLILVGKSPADFYSLLWRGGFGTAFSLQNTLQRAAPLILTALAMAIPARIGLIMIGGEGALVLSGFSAAAIALPLIGVAPRFVLLPVMALAAVAAGALWVGLAGYLRHARGVNETISSLLLTYIAIAIMNFFVEGALRDPGSANKPSTFPIGEANMIGSIPGTDVHWGLAAGIVLCIALHLLMSRTTFGFAARITGGNPRAALAQGLPVGRLVVACSMIAGACAGVAGFFEVAAIHGRANASLAAGYGFTGILVAFLARHSPLAIVPVAILFGGIAAAGGLIQRRMGLPDASVLVLQGLIFVVLLVSETLYGRFAIFSGERSASRT
ncbi:MAG: ABC transporter permease [Hyphomicrobiaceae bacterium]|nr:ABC transporter permease [Hyphomicrobiaceae bacterium]